MTEQWISAHVFYEGDLDPLVVGLVDPVTTELTRLGLVRRSFYLRYWDGGPHLRWRLLPAGEDCAARVRATVDRRVQAFLTARPSPDRLSDEAYRASAEQLATWERVSPLQARHPNNSLAHIPYLRESARYGTGERIAGVEEHFHQASRLACETLRRSPTRRQRETQALALIMLAEHLLREAGLHRDRDGTRAWTGLLEQTGAADRAALDDAYERQRDSLSTLAGQTGRLARGRAGLPRQAPFARWMTSLLPLLVAPGPDDGGLDPVSVVDLCTHLMCNRLGVRLEAEGVLRLLAVRALTGAPV